VAKELTAIECAADFLARPLGSKIAVLASQQSEILADMASLEQGLKEAKAKIEEQPDYVASAWTVLAVDPRTVEFWQGATNRMHQRLRFSISDEDGT
jgi:pyridoxamine 5'-phosphate oxidase